MGVRNSLVAATQPHLHECILPTYTPMHVAAMKRKAVAGTMESTSSNPTEDAPSSQTAAEYQVASQGEPSTHSPAAKYTEIVEPLMQPSHTTPAEKEPAYTTEKEARV